MFSTVPGAVAPVDPPACHMDHKGKENGLTHRRANQLTTNAPIKFSIFFPRDFLISISTELSQTLPNQTKCMPAWSPFLLKLSSQ